MDRPRRANRYRGRAPGRRRRVRLGDQPAGPRPGRPGVGADAHGPARLALLALYLLAAPGDSLWVASVSNVLRVRPSDGALLGKVGFGDQAVLPIDGLAAGAGALWVIGDAQTVRVDRGPTGRWRPCPRSEPFVASGSAPAGAGDHDTMVVRDSQTLYLLDPATTGSRPRSRSRARGRWR